MARTPSTDEVRALGNDQLKNQTSVKNQTSEN